jgi:hypothetical protein
MGETVWEVEGQFFSDQAVGVIVVVHASFIFTAMPVAAVPP